MYDSKLTNLGGISGVSPADISVLLVYLQQINQERKKVEK